MEPASAISAREEEDRSTEKREEEHEEDVAAKRPRLEDEEEQELQAGPDIGPMRYTDSGPPRFGGIPYNALEIFSLKVAELKEEDGLRWPLHVFGLVAVRDSMDHRRNILFQRSKDNCQDPYLVLTGPSRAIALIDPPEFEVELRAIGTRPSEEKLLCGLYFEYTNRGRYKAGLVQTCRKSSKRCTVELKISELRVPLEATIEVQTLQGSSDFHGQFFAHMDYMGDDNIVLLDSTDRKVTVKSDGWVLLSWRVVLVEEGMKLVLGVKAWQSGDGKDAAEDTVEFPARFHSKSNGFFNVGFCQMSVSVAWSVLC